jgi:hypothetical protein
MENDDESHDEANYASKPGHLWSSQFEKSPGDANGYPIGWVYYFMNEQSR